MFDCCLVSSLSPMVFYNILLPMFSAGRSPASLLLVCVPPRPTAAWLLLRSVVPYHSLYLLLLLRPSHQVRLLFLSTSLLSLGYPSPTPPSLFLTGYFNAQISGFRYPSPAPPRLFLTGYFNAQISGFRYPSPAPPRLFLAGYLDAQVSVFRCPSPTPPRLFLTGYFDAQVSLFRYPRAFFSLPVLVSLIVFFDALFFSHPTFPSRLLGWLALSLCRLAVRLRFLPLRGFYRPAVFTAPRFLPLRGFYRSAFAGFLGALLFRRPHACCPPVFTHFRAARSLCRLAVRLRFLPLRGFYRSAVFTAPRFLPLSGFYRPAVFTAPLSPVFWGLCSSAALMLAAPQSSPTSGRLALCATLRFACDFYRPAFFLPLRGFYRSAVFTAPLSPVFWGLCSSAALVLAAPQSSPTSGRLALCATLRYACDFYRSAVFTAPRFLPLRDFYRSAFAGSLGGSALPCCPPIFTLFRAHPVLPARPSRLRWAAILDLLFVPPA